MGIGLIQLIAFGVEDVYLTGNPQITFFKKVYRRHTNFAIESIQQSINGTVQPGSKNSITISRNGDLLTQMWMSFNPSKMFNTVLQDPNVLFGVCSDLGHAIIDQVEMEIGGNTIDRHYSKWLTIWRDLNDINPYGCQCIPENYGQEPKVNVPTVNQADYTKKFCTSYQKMSYTHGPFIVDMSGSPLPLGSEVSILKNAPTECYVPMRFWFSKNPGLALPLISLQHHEVKLNIQFNNVNKILIYPCTRSYDTNLNPYYTYNGNAKLLYDYSSIKVFAEYIFLDSDERKHFANNNHEYLIEQVQYQKGSGSNVILRLNHPVKELIWTGSSTEQTDDRNSGNIPFTLIPSPATPYQIVPSEAFNVIPGPNFIINYLPSSIDTFTAKLVFNGNDRFYPRHLNYFTRQQIWEHHTGFGSSILNNDSIAVYSFALRPEEHQPSGTCNFSRISTANIVFETVGSGVISTFSSLTLDIFAVNYNVLRIGSGMGGLAYSN